MTQKSSGIEKIFQVGFLIAFFLFCIVVTLYSWRFGPGQGVFSFSADSRDWAEFGEYVGGTLGGAIGFLAFIDLLINLIYQRAQIDEMHQRARIEDEQRESRFYLDEYRAGYNTAYEILESAKPSQSDFCMKWIAASRVMETARRLSERIKTASVRDVLLLDLPLQSQKFFKFFEFPAEQYYGIDPNMASFLMGADRLDEAARQSTVVEFTGSLRQVPQEVIHTIWAAVQYPKDYDDVVRGAFDERETKFLPPGLKAYVEHANQWNSVNGNLVPRNSLQPQ